MKIFVAIDSFKGCMASSEANEAAAEGIRSWKSDAEVIQVPVSDGGEGWLEAFHAAIGGDIIEVAVCDPLMRPITAKYMVAGHRAIIETAQASGLMLLSQEERNPMMATSYGTGQLVADAVRRGCREIVVGLGGSATTDCGIGMLRAIIDNYAENGSWEDVTALRDVRFTIATDVENPLCGENGAAHVFAPQKGATAEMVVALDARAKRFAEYSARHFGYDRQYSPGAGAAGGLGYAFLQYMNANCRPGAELLFEAVRFDELLKDAALVITGEGSADRQTLMGKLPYVVLQHAKRLQVPVCLIAGRIADRQHLCEAGFSEVACINPPNLPLTEAIKPAVAKGNLRQTTLTILNRLLHPFSR